MFFRVRSLPLSVTLFSLLLLPLSSQAISISAFRIFLDTDKPTTSFTVHNPNVERQDCRLKLVHYNFDEDSEIINVPEDVIPENSASNWIRFAPQEFTLTAANSQTIRFTLRKKANTTPEEYRSYLVIDCDPVSNDDEKKQLITIKPKLMHNVPVIVRTGKLEANIHVDNIKLEEHVVTFSVERSGNRSVYADVELVNKDSDEVVSSQTGFSIYVESARYPLKLALNGHSPEDLKIRVRENIHLSGDLFYETDLIPK